MRHDNGESAMRSIGSTFAFAVPVAAALVLAGCSRPDTEGGPTPARVAQDLAARNPAGAVAAPAAPDPAPAATVEITEAARAEAETVFTTRCVVCHGPTGAGEGPTAAALVPKPRNFHDASWQTSVTDAHIEKIIVNGGPAVGKSPLMPPNPDLQAKPAVVGALREKIRNFGK
jgi:mono/diheme cytochrome c family protein